MAMIKVRDGNGCVFEIDEKSPNCDVITKDFTEDEMKNDIFDLTEIPMEVLDKSYVRYVSHTDIRYERKISCKITYRYG